MQNSFLPRARAGGGQAKHSATAVDASGKNSALPSRTVEVAQGIGNHAAVWQLTGPAGIEEGRERFLQTDGSRGQFEDESAASEAAAVGAALGVAAA